MSPEHFFYLGLAAVAYQFGRLFARYVWINWIACWFSRGRNK